MANVLDCLRKLITLALLGTVLAIVCIDFNSICGATQSLLGRAGAVASLEIANVKLSFNSDTVSTAFSNLKMDDVDPGKRGRALDLIRALDQSEFVRLMYVGQLEGLCEYASPTTQMRYDLATDYRLADMRLVRIAESPDLLARVTEYMRERGSRGESPANGLPRRCYALQLTEDGANVKTALVGTFGAAFQGPAFKDAPAKARVALK